MTAGRYCLQCFCRLDPGQSGLCSVACAGKARAQVLGANVGTLVAASELGFDDPWDAGDAPACGGFHFVPKPETKSEPKPEAKPAWKPGDRVRVKAGTLTANGLSPHPAIGRDLIVYRDEDYAGCISLESADGSCDGWWAYAKDLEPALVWKLGDVAMLSEGAKTSAGQPHPQRGQRVTLQELVDASSRHFSKWWLVVGGSWGVNPDDLLPVPVPTWKPGDAAMVADGARTKYGLPHPLRGCVIVLLEMLEASGRWRTDVRAESIDPADLLPVPPNGDVEC